MHPKILLLIFTGCLCLFAESQNISWLTGEWKGISNNRKFVKTIVINSVTGTNFKGAKTVEVKDRNRSRVSVLISGNVIKDQLRINYGDVVYMKDPIRGKWWSCKYCTSKNVLTVDKDSIILTVSVEGCNDICNGVSKYYRRLNEYDSATQVTIVNTLGSSSYTTAFSPYKEMWVSQDSLSRVAAARPPEVVPTLQTNTEQLQ